MRIQYRVLQTAVALLVALSYVVLGGTWALAQEEDSNSKAQQGGNCPGAEEILSIGPDKHDQPMKSFDVKGDKFKITYKTSDLDEDGVPFLDVSVLDKDNDQVGGLVIRDKGTETEIIGDSPGKFSMEIRAQDLTYEITVDDCTGKDGSSNDNDSAATGQYGNDSLDINNGQGLGEDLGLADDQGFGAGQDAGIPDDVIADTIPTRKPLPSTGGLPLVGLVFIGLACTGLGLSVLRSATRRS